ncbi:MAG: uncharacterized protein JWN99_2968 [Ilumatobacteraceae bacterium]|nr:uncharacterized protein [Ilumatobacteraceae bacterium]
MVRRLAVIAVALALAACSSSDGGSAGDAVGTDSITTETVTNETVTTESVRTTTSTVVTGSAPATTTPATTPATTDPATSDASTTSDPSAGAFADRPYDVFVPSSYDGSQHVPLVISLHGYTSTGALQEAYFGLQPLAEDRGFLYVHPDGTKDIRNAQFWNATDACCDLASAGVDDSAYLTHIIDQVQAAYRVDAKRIFVLGHSNGGFMSYRMACDHADRVAAIVSLSGATFADSTRCQPSQPVSVLEIHGTADAVIAYDGGQILGHAYPGAQTSVATWAAYNGCGAIGPVASAQLDLEDHIAGAESSVVSYTGCPDSGEVELWTVPDGAHTPRLSPTFADDVLDFLFAHPKA